MIYQSSLYLSLCKLLDYLNYLDYKLSSVAKNLESYLVLQTVQEVIWIVIVRSCYLFRLFVSIKFEKMVSNKYWQNVLPWAIQTVALNFYNILDCIHIVECMQALNSCTYIFYCIASLQQDSAACGIMQQTGFRVPRQPSNQTPGSHNRLS